MGMKNKFFKIRKTFKNVISQLPRNARFRFMNSSGFALIFVMVFIAMIMGIVSDLVYQTQITAKNTIVQEDQILAQTAAKTGIEFAKFILTLNKLSSGYKNNPLISLPPNLFNILNGQAIGADSFKQIEGLTGINLSSAISPELLHALKAMKGYFVLNITSENAKFNLNLLQSTYSSTSAKALSRLFSSQDVEKFLELYNYTPQQLTDNLIDYIKLSVTDPALDSRVRADYNRLNLKYSPKHAALESLEELRRIPGFEVDDIYNMFSPYFTVWPISGVQNSLNINTAPTELIASFITPGNEEIAQQAWDKFDDYRINNTFAQNNMGTWFQSNLEGYSKDQDADEIRKNIFGIADTIFQINCRGVVNDMEKNIMVIVQVGQGNVQTAGSTPGSTPGSTSNTAPGTTPGSPSDSTPANSNPVQNTSSSTSPFNILYSQWVD